MTDASRLDTVEAGLKEVQDAVVEIKEDSDAKLVKVYLQMQSTDIAVEDIRKIVVVIGKQSDDAAAAAATVKSNAEREASKIWWSEWREHAITIGVAILFIIAGLGFGWSLSNWERILTMFPHR